MWQVFYGSKCLYDPRDSDLVLTDGSGTLSLDELSTFEFTMPSMHPEYGTIQPMQKATEITVEQDGTVIFRGRVTDEDTDWDNSIKYTCEADRGYLNDVVVPPYTTKYAYKAADEDKAKTILVSSRVDGYFSWLISVYNDHVSKSEQFVVGTNQGASLDPNNYIYRSSSSRPSVWSEIKEKILDSLGGFVRTRTVGGVRYIDLLADDGKAAAQRIEFGSNLTDFARSSGYTSLYTHVIPVGKTSSSESSEESSSETTIDELEDRDLGNGLYKRGNYVGSYALEDKYGTIEGTVEYESHDANYIEEQGARYLRNMTIGDTLELDAVDLHQLDKSIDAIELGTYVRATSRPHGFDEYFLCREISFNPFDASANTYKLGSNYDTLTGQQAGSLAALNASIDSQKDTVAAIDQTAKDAADAAAKAEEAVKDSLTVVQVEYAQGDSATEAPTSDWSTTAPEWVDGKYMWQRTKTIKADGTVEYSDPTNITGAKGEKGKDGTGKDGTSVTIKSKAITYVGSTSGTTVPSSGWTTSIPSVAAGSYLWTRTVVTYSDGTSTTAYSVALQGKTGAKGATGATGNGVSSINPQYYLSTSATSCTGGSWATTMPTWTSGTYIWTRSHVVYTNGTTADTTPVLDTSATQAGTALVKSTEVEQTVEGITTTVTGLTEDMQEQQTLIRQSGNGVEVARKVDGAYTSTKTIVSDTGLQVQDQDGTVLTDVSASDVTIGAANSGNVHIDNDSVDLRNGTTELATFNESSIALGKNNQNSMITFAKGTSGLASTSALMASGKRRYVTTLSTFPQDDASKVDLVISNASASSSTASLIQLENNVSSGYSVLSAETAISNGETVELESVISMTQTQNEGPYISLYMGNDAGTVLYSKGWALSDIIEMKHVYPVGCIYISYSGQSPAMLFGGTWTQLTDVVLRAANDTNTGGSDTHNHEYGIRYSGYYSAIGNFIDNKNFVSEKGMIQCVPSSGENGAPSIVRGTITSYVNSSVTSSQKAISAYEYDNIVSTTSSSTLPKYQDIYAWRRIS